MKSQAFLMYSSNICYNDSVNFSDWINHKFVIWRGESRKTVVDFAAYVGVSQSLMSKWMNPGGPIPDRHESIKKLVSAFGNEVYEVLGLPVPPASPLESAPPELRSLLESSLAEIASVLSERSIPVNSPEAEKIAAEILERHGFTISAKDNPG
jgi:hypothetical protein